MGSVANIVVTIRVNNTGVAQQLQQTQQQLNQVTSSFGAVGDQIRRMGLEVSRVGVGLTAGLTVPLVAMAALSTKAFAEYELSIRRVTSLLGEVGKEADTSFKAFYEGVKKISVVMGVDMVNSAKALYEIISTGIPKDNALAFLEVATKAGIAGLATTATAVNALTTVINAYNMDTTKAAEVSDVLFMAVNKGKFTFDQLASSLAHTMPMAAKLGISYKEIAGAAASMTLQGFTVNQSMIRIAQSMNSLLKPTKLMAATFKELGVSGGEELIRKMGGLVPALAAVRDALGGDSSLLSKAMGRYQGFQAVLSLTGDNAERTAGLIKQMNSSMGATDMAFQEIDKSFSRTWDKLKAQFQSLKVDIGEALQPVLTKLMTSISGILGKVSELVAGFKKLPESTQTFIISALAIVAALGPLAMILGKITILVGDVISVFSTGALSGIGSQLSALTGSMGGFSGVITLLGKAFVILTLAMAAFDAGKILGTFDGLGASAKKLALAIKDLGVFAFSTLKLAFDTLVAVMVPVVASLQAIGKTIGVLGGGPDLDKVSAGFRMMTVVMEEASVSSKFLAEAVGTYLKGALEEYQKMLNSVSAESSKAWEEMTAGLVAKWELVKQAALSIWGSIKTFFSDVFGGIAESTKSVWGPVAEFLIGLWMRVREAIGGTLTAISNAVGKAWAAVSGPLKNLGDAFSTLAAKMTMAKHNINKASLEINAATIASALSVANLRDAYDKASTAFVNVAKKAKEGSSEYKQALLVMMESQANLRKALGEKLPDSLTASIAKLKQEIQDMATVTDDSAKKLADLGTEVDVVTEKKKKLTQAERDFLKAQNDSLEAMSKAINKVMQGREEWQKYWKDFQNGIGPAYKELNELLRAIDDAAAKENLKKIFPPQLLTDSARDFASLTESMRKTSAAFDTMGVKSTNSILAGLDNAKKAYEQIRNMSEEEMERNYVTIQDKLRMEKAYLETKLQATRSTNDIMTREELERLKILQDAFQDTSVTAEKAINSMGKMGKEVSLILNDMTRGMADAIVHGKNFGEVMTKAFTALKEALVRIFIKETLEEMVKAMGLSEASMTGFFNKIGAWLGLKGDGKSLPQAVEAAAKSAANAGKIAGETAELAKKAAETANEVSKTSMAAAQETTKAADAVKQAATSTTSALGKVGDVVSMVSDIVGAIAGILSYIVQRRMEKDIARIEVTTRGLLNLSIAHQDSFNKYLPALSGLMEYMWGFMTPAFQSLMTTAESAVALLGDILLELRKGLISTSAAAGGDGSGPAGEVSDELILLKNKLEESQREIDALQKNLKQLGANTLRASQSAGGASSSVGDFSGAVDGATGALGTAGESISILAENADRYSNSLSYATDSMEAAGRRLATIALIPNTPSEQYNPWASNPSANPAGIRLTNPDLTGFAQSLQNIVTPLAGITLVPKEMAKAGAALGAAATTLAELDAKARAGTLSQAEYVRWKYLQSLQMSGGLSYSPNLSPASGYPAYDPSTVSGLPATNTNWNLTVQVNNADATQVANTMIDTFRQRGVDL